jgi:hypothetical protein
MWNTVEQVRIHDPKDRMAIVVWAERGHRKPRHA